MKLNRKQRTKNEESISENLSQEKIEVKETIHKIKVNGETISYSVKTGYLILKNDKGDSRAKIFFTSYTKNNVSSLDERPITFCFNGGPGSSSVWLHLGGLGPKRVLMTEDGHAISPPYKLIDNEFSWLDLTDMVFIDPVSTGFSRACEGEDERKFHSYKEDIATVGEFIRLFTTKYMRWSSPKFIAGESYGTTRASGLCEYMQTNFGMYFNGIILISVALNFQTLEFKIGNDLPYILFLPSYTATSWYHNALSQDLQNKELELVLKEVEDFAINEYSVALMKGDSLSDTEIENISKKLSKYTGLSEKYIRQTKLRIGIFRFAKELLRDNSVTVGRLDSRMLGTDRDDAGENFEYDPSYNGAIYGPFSTCINDYIRRELKYENDIPYEILTPKVWPWNFEHHNHYLNVSETLRQAMNQNKFLNIWVASGYYDLGTPYFATDYTMNHLGLNKDLKSNLFMTYYKSGHMMYIHKPSLIQLKEDAKTFYSNVLEKYKVNL